MKKAEEIVKNTSELPLKYQELVLDKIKAMIVTKKVIQKREKSGILLL